MASLGGTGSFVNGTQFGDISSIKYYKGREKFRLRSGEYLYPFLFCKIEAIEDTCPYPVVKSDT